MTHEDFSRQEDIKPSSDRSFGLTIATFFLIVALWPLIHSEPVRWWALGVAAAFLVPALLCTAALAPLNKMWVRLGLLLNAIDAARIESDVAFDLLHRREWRFIAPDRVLGGAVADLDRIVRRVALVRAMR